MIYRDSMPKEGGGGWISDTLINKEPGTKPRFFLHDEIKEWLKNHLEVSQTFSALTVSDSQLGTKLNTSGVFTKYISSTVTLSIDGDVVKESHRTIPIDGIIESIRPLANVVEVCMIKITELQAENEDLKKRIELLENPIPV